MNPGGSIRVISECFIKPKCIDESKKTFYLGSFELAQIPRFHIQHGLLFRKIPPTQSGDGSIKSEHLERLKQSFMETLHHFYPLAGQLEREEGDETEKCLVYVDCKKGPGAKLIHAAMADMNVDDIVSRDYVPPIIESYFDLGLVPRNCDGFSEPLLVAQVTELADGVFVSVSVNHCVADGTTFWHFVSSWSEIFQLNNNGTGFISRPPICERWFPDGHGPLIKIPKIHLDEMKVKSNVETKVGSSTTLRDAIFQVSSESVAALKEKANSESGMVNKISSFQALSTAIWRFIVRARRREPDEECICIIPANARPRMVPPLSQEYLGCFAVIVWNEKKVSELVENSFGKVALAVHQKVKEITFEHLRDRFVGWAKCPQFGSVGMKSPNSIALSGTPREDMYKVEFGFGKPIAILRGSTKYDGRVVIQAGKEGGGSVSIQVCLSEDAMVALQHDQQFLSLLS